MFENMTFLQSHFSLTELCLALQTIVVVAVLPLGVVQLGSLNKVCLL